LKGTSLHPPFNDDNTKITFIKEDPWRIFRIMAEFVDSFETLSQLVPALPSRSARTPPEIPIPNGCGAGQRIGEEQTRGHHGGDQGIMEAANKGAYLAKGNQSASHRIAYRNKGIVTRHPD